MLPTIHPSLRQLACKHDSFIVDLWGTIHDGYNLKPGAAECLRQMQNLGPVCLLSNANRRATTETARLRSMGLDRSYFNSIVTAGEICRLRLKYDLPSHVGNRFFYLGKEENSKLLSGLGFSRVQSVSSADFLLVGDPEDDKQDLVDYSSTLKRAHECDLVLVCPNPDLRSVWGGQERKKPGAIATLYDQLGGETLWYGKPHSHAFQAACRTFSNATSTLVIGDGISNDIVGGHAYGLDVCFVAGGRESVFLQVAAGECPTPMRVFDLIRGLDLQSLDTIPRLVW